MISHELSMIQLNDPLRAELASHVEAFLSVGGTIQELVPFTYAPPPIRHEPPAKKKAKSASKPKPTLKVDKLTQRDIDRERRAIERAAAKEAEEEHIRKLAETMTMAQAILRVGMSRRTLIRIAEKGGFKFQPATIAEKPKSHKIDEAKDTSNAERIRAFKEIGLTRNQAREKIGITYTSFIRLLEKFDIDYPKAFSRPACPKTNSI